MTTPDDITTTTDAIEFVEAPELVDAPPAVAVRTHEEWQELVIGPLIDGKGKARPGKAQELEAARFFYAGARTANGWPVGLTMTSADFDAAIAAFGKTPFRAAR